MSTPARMSLKELFRACKEGDVESVRRAVESGLNVKNAVDKEWSNYTPLHYACRYEIIIKLFQYTACTRILYYYSSKISLHSGCTRHRANQRRVHLCSLVGVIVMGVIVMHDLCQRLPCGQKVP